MFVAKIINGRENLKQLEATVSSCVQVKQLEATVSSCVQVKQLEATVSSCVHVRHWKPLLAAVFR